MKGVDYERNSGDWACEETLFRVRAGDPRGLEGLLKATPARVNRSKPASI